MYKICKNMILKLLSFYSSLCIPYSEFFYCYVAVSREPIQKYATSDSLLLPSSSCN